MSQQLRVAVIGCGQIADAHLQEVAKIPAAKLVAVCDAVPDLARQAAARFGVPGVYDDVAKMLAEATPNVVHITTPPHTHAPLAKLVIAAGCHAYVEKPFTVTVAETDEVLAAAAAANRLVCVGHDQQFDPCWADLQARHAKGDLGKVVHVDSVMGYNLDGPFGRIAATDPGHWLHRLPGGLFQNNISHAMYKVTEFLTDDRPRVWATWFGPDPASPSELRVMLRGQHTTGTVLFSSEARPNLRTVRVYGTKATVEVDFDGRTLRWYRALGAPGPFAKIQAPLRHLTEAGRSLTRSLWKFVRSDLQYFAGMNRLFRQFYKAIQTGGPCPTPPADIRRVTVVMDDIFEACRREAEVPNTPPAPSVNGQHSKPVGVGGAS